MDWSEEGYLALSALNVKDGYIDFNQDVHYGNQELYDKWMTGNELHKGQVLFTTEAPMGNVAQVPDNRRYILSQRTIAFEVKNKLITENFLATVLRTPTVFADLTALSSGGTAKGVSQKSLASVEIRLPKDLNEQEKIANTFYNLDHLITLHQCKCHLLLKLLHNDWEQRKLGELYSILTERNTDLLPYNITLSVATMTYKTDGNGAADSSLANYKRLRIGDIAFEGHTSKEFRYGRFVLNDAGDGIMSPRFSALRPYTQMPTTFWKYYIHYEPIMRKVLVNSTKAGTMMNELVVDEFLKSSLYVPSKEEQACIGGYFTTLDHLITLHHRKYIYILKSP